MLQVIVVLFPKGEFLLFWGFHVVPFEFGEIQLNYNSSVT